MWGEGGTDRSLVTLEVGKADLAGRAIALLNSSSSVSTVSLHFNKATCKVTLEGMTYSALALLMPAFAVRGGRCREGGHNGDGGEDAEAHCDGFCLCYLFEVVQDR